MSFSPLFRFWLTLRSNVRARPVIVAILNASGVAWTENTWRAFGVKLPFSNSSRVARTGPKFGRLLFSEKLCELQSLLHARTKIIFRLNKRRSLHVLNAIRIWVHLNNLVRPLIQNSHLMASSYSTQNLWGKIRFMLHNLKVRFRFGTWADVRFDVWIEVELLPFYLTAVVEQNVTVDRKTIVSIVTDSEVELSVYLIARSWRDSPLGSAHVHVWIGSNTTDFNLPVNEPWTNQLQERQCFSSPLELPMGRAILARIKKLFSNAYF